MKRIAEQQVSRESEHFQKLDLIDMDGKMPTRMVVSGATYAVVQRFGKLKLDRIQMQHCIVALKQS